MTRSRRIPLVQRQGPASTYIIMQIPSTHPSRIQVENDEMDFRIYSVICLPAITLWPCSDVGFRWKPRLYSYTTFNLYSCSCSQQYFLDQKKPSISLFIYAAPIEEFISVENFQLAWLRIITWMKNFLLHVAFSLLSPESFVVLLRWADLELPTK